MLLYEYSNFYMITYKHGQIKYWSYAIFNKYNLFSIKFIAFQRFACLVKRAIGSDITDHQSLVHHSHIPPKYELSKNYYLHIKILAN